MTTVAQEEVTEIRPQTGPQEDFLSSPADIAIFGGSAGSGKMLCVRTKIPTPTGWKLMGDLKSGDMVLNEQGKPCKVLVAHPIKIPDKCYRLTFDDKTVIDACSEHLWFTLTARDRGETTTKTEDWRKRRRATRLSRVSGRKSAAFAKSLRARNRARAVSMRMTLSGPSTGTAKTTADIARTLHTRKGSRANHAIPVTAPIKLRKRKFVLDPYLLGIWLGDGTTTSGSITTSDPEVVASFQQAGFDVNKLKDKYGWTPHGLSPILRAIGVLGNKHVPAEYLRGSVQQRMALVQGLMDSDGCAGDSGSVEFTSTRWELTSAVAELARSLGSKCAIHNKKVTLDGRDCGQAYIALFSPAYPVFRLPRKLARQKIEGHRRTTRFRYITKCKDIPPRPMRCITVDSPSSLYLCSEGFVPTHNTYALILEALRNIHIRGYNAVIFRRTVPQVRSEGGLWDESAEVYPLIGGIPRESTPEWRFPGGTTIRFAHMVHDRNRLDWQGSQIAFLGFDELTHFSAMQFWYMLSRCRTMCGVRPYIRATCNPDPDSFVADLVSWYIDEDTGYPIPERSGALRYFVRRGNKLVWANSAHELAERYNDVDEVIDVKSFTFIAARIFDNKILLEKDPMYLGNLRALPLVDRERLLHGNWKVRATAGNVYRPRQWIGVVDAAPKDVTRVVRYWDRAATEKKDSNDPAYTAGCRASIDGKGMIYVEDMQRFRNEPPEVLKGVKNTASHDTVQVDIFLEQDPAQAGKMEVQYLIAELAGYNARAIRAVGSKVIRAKPASAQMEAGNIKMVQGRWNKDFVDELEAFPDGKFKDQADAFSGAVSVLLSGRTGGPRIRAL